MEYNVCFKINGKIFTFQIPHDEENDLIFKMTNDDEYTYKYIKAVIDSGQLDIGDSLNTIGRVSEEGSVTPLYNNSNSAQEIPAAAQTDACENEQKNNWGEPQTKFVLDKYTEYIEMVGPQKKFKNKKSMWQQISGDLKKELNIDKTHIQIENRYKTVCKRKKETIDSNATSGATRVHVPFEAEMNNIAALDDSIEPTVLRSANNARVLKACENLDTSHSTSQGGTKRKRLADDKTSMRNLLLQLHDKREEAKERRHRENLQLLRELFSQNNNN